VGATKQHRVCHQGRNDDCPLQPVHRPHEGLVTRKLELADLKAGTIEVSLNAVAHHWLSIGHESRDRAGDDRQAYCSGRQSCAAGAFWDALKEPLTVGSEHAIRAGYIGLAEWLVKGQAARQAVKCAHRKRAAC
jgi:hypothetical protein